MIKAFVNRMGIDFHVGYTMMYRMCSILSGTLLVLLIPFYLSAEEQGFYYTFTSLIGLQIFFELGLNFVVIQLVSHEMPYISMALDGALSGNAENVARLRSLFRFLLKWYVIAALFFLALVAPAGYLFMHSHTPVTANYWPYAWFLLVFFSYVSLCISPILSFFEGMGRVGDVAKLRLIQALIGLFVVAIAFHLNFGLFVAPLATLSALCVLFFWLKENKLWLLHLFIGDVEKSVNWGSEIFPFQYRIAISWLSGYFIFQAFVPMVFYYQGVVSAGKVGLAISIFSGISTFSLSWISANMPKMARMIASDVEKKALNSFFNKLLLRSALTFLFVWLGVCFVLTYIFNLNISISEKLPSIKILLVLGAIFFLQQVFGGLAIYVRSHKQEPFTLNAIVTGILIIGSLYLGLKKSLIMGLYFCLASVLCSLVWGYFIFRSYYNKPSAVL